MSTKTVYLVTSGSYSDYRVDAIFSTRKKANDYMKVVQSSDYNGIEECELDPPATDLIKRGYSVWHVQMLRDGTVEKAWKTENRTHDVNGISYHIWERSKAAYYKGTDTKDVLSSAVWAKTETQAIKIVNEQRTQMIATGKWKD